MRERTAVNEVYDQPTGLGVRKAAHPDALRDVAHVCRPHGLPVRERLLQRGKRANGSLVCRVLGENRADERVQDRALVVALGDVVLVQGVSGTLRFAMEGNEALGEEATGRREKNGTSEWVRGCAVHTISRDDGHGPFRSVGPRSGRGRGGRLLLLCLCRQTTTLWGHLRVKNFQIHSHGSTSHGCSREWAISASRRPSERSVYSTVIPSTRNARQERRGDAPMTPSSASAVRARPSR